MAKRWFVDEVNECVRRGFGDAPVVVDAILPAGYLKVRLADGRVVALVSDGSIEAVIAGLDDGED